MEDFFKEHPFSIGFGVAGFLLLSWIFSSIIIGLVGALIGAIIGIYLEK